MNKLIFPKDAVFSDLPTDYFNSLKFSVYIMNPQWNYLFVNDFVQDNLRKTSGDLIGKNMWQIFPALAADPSFAQMKISTEKGVNSNFITISPITSQRINVTGQPLKDCYFFTASILPKKEDLLNELREALPKK